MRLALQAGLAADAAALLGVGPERVTCAVNSSTDAAAAAVPAAAPPRRALQAAPRSVSPLKQTDGAGDRRREGRRLAFAASDAAEVAATGISSRSSGGSGGGGGGLVAAAVPVPATAFVALTILPSYSPPDVKTLAGRLLAAASAAAGTANASATADSRALLNALSARSLGPPLASPAPAAAYAPSALSALPLPSAVAALSYASVLSLGPDAALAWSVDDPGNALHLCLARAVAGAAQRSWFGISFNALSSLMVPSDVRRAAFRRPVPRRRGTHARL